MQAKETKLQDIIEGTKQYVVPLFQRTYSWTQKEWEVLWKDLVELCEMDTPRTHFIGSMVNMPTVSVPEGVAKYLLIDGQQRLTTVFILLILLRDRAKDKQNLRFAGEIENTLLVNQYKDGSDHYKLLPTQVDRQVFENLIDGQVINVGESSIIKAYSYFEKKLKQVELEPEKLKKIITQYFSIVSIVLDIDDNPYLVFESLNAKGKPLAQADLIRNYFFMRIDISKQDTIYNEYWLPMYTALDDNLTEFIRHFLMKDGSIIKQSDVYYALKEKVNLLNVTEYLSQLKCFSTYYQCLIDPDFESDSQIKKYLKRLNRIEVTTAYPLLLNFYHDYHNQKISKGDFVELLQTLENYLIRRFICGVASNQLNKIFPSIYSQISANYSDDPVKGFKYLLQGKNYPKDNEFYSKFRDVKVYGNGDRRTKTALILETLEEGFSHKEQVPFNDLTVEHIMPQTLTPSWERELGERFEETHDLFLHTIGNLTLTAYNSELSNDDFVIKQQKLINSHLELNKYFSSVSRWTRDEIEQRTEQLVLKAINIWSYFGQENSPESDRLGVTGTTPLWLTILGEKFSVGSWRDVMEKTFNTIAYLEPEKFALLVQSFPSHLSNDGRKFRATRQLENGYYIETNLSAQNIQKVCYQAISTIELTSDEWDVIFR
jgi:uncharacterized protein with ParB-like and HNH nuclease domain